MSKNRRIRDTSVGPRPGGSTGRRREVIGVVSLGAAIFMLIAVVSLQAGQLVMGPFGRQVVLTGGGAELKGIADYAQGVLGRSVRVGRPRGLIGMPEAHSGMSFATLSGLVLYAASDPIDLRIAPAPQQITRMSPSGTPCCR